MGKRGFRDLQVWQVSKDLAVAIYGITNSPKFARDFGLRDQMRRAAVSIPSNIAEGDERETDRESVRYFYIARGSTAEIVTQAIIAYEVGYITEEVFRGIESQCGEIAGMLSKLIKARSRTFAK